MSTCRECGTPDRPIHAKGLCNRCYMRQYMREYNARPGNNYELRSLKSSFNARLKKSMSKDASAMTKEELKEHVAKWEKCRTYYTGKILELQRPRLVEEQRKPIDWDNVNVVKIP